MTTKNQYVSITALVVSCACLITVVMFLLNKQNVGFVESNILLTEYSEAQKAREQINEKITEWDANLTTLQQELETLNQEMVEKAEQWKQSERDAHLATMREKQQEYARYNAAVSQKATELEAELMQPIYDAINTRMKDYGEAKGFDLVFGTVQGGNILYGADAVNVTEDFISYLEGK